MSYSLGFWSRRLRPACRFLSGRLRLSGRFVFLQRDIDINPGTNGRSIFKNEISRHLQPLHPIKQKPLSDFLTVFSNIDGIGDAIHCNTAVENDGPIRAGAISFDISDASSDFSRWDRSSGGHDDSGI